MIAFVLTLIGTMLLCISMRKHWKQILPEREHSAGAAKAMRAAGYVLLLSAAIVSIASWGTGYGLTLFVAFLNVAVFGIAIAIPYRYRNQDNLQSRR